MFTFIWKQLNSIWLNTINVFLRYKMIIDDNKIYTNYNILTYIFYIC
jgi:hypothetical protein